MAAHTHTHTVIRTYVLRDTKQGDENRQDWTEYTSHNTLNDGEEYPLLSAFRIGLMGWHNSQLVPMPPLTPCAHLSVSLSNPSSLSLGPQEAQLETPPFTF